MSDIVDACKAQARGRGKRVVFPEGHDERIVAAARRLQDEQIAQPILLGTAAEIEAAATRAQVSIEGLTTRDPQTSDRISAYASLYT
ncbi:MAG TPA: phosphate acyltransferase, partial [Burkholderiales bacterium]|nr:phosphate acyltransferase [Burkholderiales bacterium]